ncbi:unnamed protein product [Spirodela intermedia]|uniref:Protein ENHANCED DISEASE RESISTANCE 2 C-terminal domain-containing protein n=1 Tax=Spirodela intermedia TaxID=51605 RepID=A0A7I8INM6_SPIIN|nr:unnamed protein product [Spirodela intermedia]CAA6659053.1 unnamed protein product [Spirodela intermedia]
MGACMSRREEGCTGGRLMLQRRLRRQRRRVFRRRTTPLRSATMMTIAEIVGSDDGGDGRRPFSIPSIQGTEEDSWFDTVLSLESDCGEEFLSVRDEKTSINRSQSSKDEMDGGDRGRMLDNCCILLNICSPCLPPTASEIETRGSLSSSAPSSRKKAATKFSISARFFLERPLAGCQVPFCLLEKKMPDTWSYIEPSRSRFGERTILGTRMDKKKVYAPKLAAYYPFGMDVFLCQYKIDHFCSLCATPSVTSSGKFPSTLIVNVQIPLYPTSFFQSNTDGEGMSFVLYFRLSESFSKDSPSHFQDNLRKLISNEVEKVKAFPVDTLLPTRERLKLLGRVANIEDLHLTAAERKLIHAYNEKPVLSRPQHDFTWQGEDYLEIDIDMHRFSYISRKGFEAFLDRLNVCILDIGMTIQGNKPEELPEQVLCCMRLNGIDYSRYRRLSSP